MMNLTRVTTPHIAPRFSAVTRDPKLQAHLDAMKEMGRAAVQIPVWKQYSDQTLAAASDWTAGPSPVAFRHVGHFFGIVVEAGRLPQADQAQFVQELRQALPDLVQDPATKEYSYKGYPVLIQL